MSFGISPGFGFRPFEPPTDDRLLLYVVGAAGGTFTRNSVATYVEDA